MYYFVYLQSLPASRVDFINEWKKIYILDPPSKKKVVNCVGAKAKDRREVFSKEVANIYENVPKEECKTMAKTLLPQGIPE